MVTDIVADMANMEVNKVAIMVADMAADMELDMVADMEVGKVADKVADMVVNMVGAKKEFSLTSTSTWKSILVRELVTGVG